VALAIAPWIPRYLDHGTDYPLPRYSLRFLLAVPIEYVGGNGVVLLVCLTIIGIGLISFEHRRPVVSHVTENLILLSWMLLPPAAMFAYSRVGRPIFGPPRYHMFIAPAYLILLARGLCRLPVLPRVGLAAGAFVLSLSAIDANVYSQVVKADWRGLAGWLDEGGAAELAGPGQGPITVVVHPSDPRFPRDQVEAARYYLSPRYRVVLGESGSPGRAEIQAGQAVLEMDCLSAEQVREGDNVPGFYGLVIRRR
jgi:hypothetical protein